MTNFARTFASRAHCAVSLAALTLLSACSTEKLADRWHPEGGYVVSDLGASSLEKRVLEIDENYKEPRSDYRVAHSFEAARDSVSPVNNYEALWRLVRAAAWLGQNHPVPSMRTEYARAGISFGREAKKHLSNRVEAWYYVGLCWIALGKQYDSPTLEQVYQAKYHLANAVEIDSGFDYCGPLRELGDLHRRLVASDYSDSRAGSLGEALKLLQRACDTCPDFGGNQLALARALSANQQFAEARFATDSVLRASIPSDYSVEHRQWLYDAQTLRERISLLDNRSVEATAFQGVEAGGAAPEKLDDTSVPVSPEGAPKAEGSVQTTSYQVPPTEATGESD